MRQRPATRHADSNEGEDVMLDSAEQRALLADLAATAARHARTWRSTFGALGLVLGLAFLWFAARQVCGPACFAPLPSSNSKPVHHTGTGSSLIRERL